MNPLVLALVLAQTPAQLRPLFAPLPPQFETKDNALTPERVALGRMLYFDKRLSKNHDVACNSCHLLDRYGVDGEPVSTGHKKQKGGRNAPTVYNAGAHLAQFWDGRAPTLEEQAKGPILNPLEMALPTAEAAVKVIASVPGYLPLFQKAFPGEASPITYDNIAKAIGAFERTLSTPSRFDRWVKGDDAALTKDELDGLETFAAVGCAGCHQGAAVGGTMYQKLGLVAPVPNLADKGRFDVTKAQADLNVFKVPSLRNIARTAPYLHDGSLKSLDEVIVFMGKHQLGRALEPLQVRKIATFLQALTGDLPKDVAPPKLPPSGKATPKPDPS